MALVPGKTDLQSGTGHWSMVLPTNVTSAIDDPATRAPIPPSGVVPLADFALFPTIKLVVNLAVDGTSTITMVGTPDSHWPTPPDSVGYTVNFELDVVNNTGKAVQGVTLNLANLVHEQPLAEVPGIIEYGETVNANYAFFTHLQPIAGHNTFLYTPSGQLTTATGPAASRLLITGDIAPGATVATVGAIHNTELTASSNDFTLSVTDIPKINRFATTDTTTGQSAMATGDPYTGPVAGLAAQFVLSSNDNMNVLALQPFSFIHTGDGNDAIDVSGVNGNNTLDGGSGSNFLVGGTGKDTFFVDDRGPTKDIWTTIKGFHSGDDATIFGLTPTDFKITPLDNQGAPGSTGLTFSITAAGKPNANLTMTGYTVADLNNGRLSVTFGRTQDTPGLAGSNFMQVHAN